MDFTSKNRIFSIVVSKVITVNTQYTSELHLERNRDRTLIEIEHLEFRCPG